MNHINRIEFHTAVNEIANENHLVIVKLKYGETSQLSQGIITYSTDNNA